jgi:hypothetical protein
VKDPIIDELRRVRKKIEADHGNDWDRLVRHLIERQNANPRRPIVPLQAAQMLREPMTRTTITQHQFHELTLPIIGLPVSFVWRGCGSAIFLEIGEIIGTIPPGKDDRGTASHTGRFGVMIQWSWRVERPKSIYFGSFSSDRVIDNRLAKLQQRTVKAVEVEGRLPELVIQLSGGLWVHSFATEESQPEWCLFLDRTQSSQAWLSSEHGKLIKETK